MRTRIRLRPGLVGLLLLALCLPLAACKEQATPTPPPIPTPRPTATPNAEAVLTGSKKVVMQALLADMNVNTVGPAEAMLDTILRRQSQYLGYIH